MPTYHVDLVTDNGLQRVPFTLDDDRPLGAQVRHVLEELRQRGLVLRGGPEDRLAVVWNGREVDLEQTPEALRISPLYPIELKMRRPEPRAAVRSEPPAKPFLPKGSYIGAVAGFTGAALAWVTGTLFTDLGDVLVSYGALDLVVAALLGAGVGVVVTGLAALRRNDNVVGWSALGLALGGLGGVTGALAGLFLAGLGGLAGWRQGFVLARLVVWGLTAGLSGLFLAFCWLGRDRHRLLDGILFGIASGVVGGLVMSLPGPTEFWQLAGFGLVGAVLGYGLSRPARALGLVELETAGGRSPGLLGHREWEVRDNVANGFGRRFEIRASKGRLKLVPVGGGGEPALLAGKPVSAPADLVNDDTIDLGVRRFRFRRFPEAAL
jgi:hypothetical protein